MLTKPLNSPCRAGDDEPVSIDVGSVASSSQRDREQGGQMADMEDDENNAFTDLDDFLGPLEEYLVNEVTRKQIKRRSRQLISDFRDESGEPSTS